MKTPTSLTLTLTLALVLLVPALVAAQANDIGVLLMADKTVVAALARVKINEPEILAEQARICEIPAPSFGEEMRGLEFKTIFTKLGLRNVRIDATGNVLGDRPGKGPKPHLVFAAHLDTVFPVGTNVHVTKDGTWLKGPGIGDDCRGLAVLIGVIRALNEAKVVTEGSITFVANVGEEGLGDLRGTRALFNDTLKGTIDRFVSVDGGGLGMTNVGVGSFRYRLTYRGPGGHSYGAFGLVNPIHALGRAIAAVSEFQVAKEPKTTFNVGRIGGGTSVNSIPSEAWAEVDMRSHDKASLDSLHATFLAAADAAAAAENKRWGNGTITVEKKSVGIRPPGATPATDYAVTAAASVTRAFGFSVEWSQGSTDSNVPMSLGISAITIGGGGHGTDAHARAEAFDTTDSWKGTQRAVVIAIALAR
ncbi:MAG: M20/M25/M40 family metallo-hydrolase [Acidobacteria bacterium]|nr:M20/M25/M40 family metallo-hydrolase [Acidobacteriota bacterium]